MTDQEIERKFLVDLQRLPFALDECRRVQIQQGYLAVSQDGAEVRLRRLGAKCLLTFKSGGDLSRSEIEVELTSDQFASLWPATQNQRVEKCRYEIELQDDLIELDVFEERLAGLVTAEVEFSSEHASQRFRPPDWFTSEVTYDARYKNKNLARSGAP